MKEHSVEEISINDQIIRFFDRESRLYLAGLCEKIFDYDTDMLELDEHQYEAPFQPNKVGDLNRRKAFSIFSADPLGFNSQLSKRTDDLLPKKSSLPGADLS